MVALNVLIKISFFAIFISMLYLVLDFFIQIVVINLNTQLSHINSIK